jgi:hypothetical protein
VQRHSLFRLASTTKPVTGAATLTLVREGLLTLDEPRDRLLPELANPRVPRRMDGIDDDVSLAPVDLLAGVVATAVLADGIRTANRLRIDDSGCRFTLAAFGDAHHLTQRVVKVIERAVRIPSREVPVHRLP